MACGATHHFGHQAARRPDELPGRRARHRQGRDHAGPRSPDDRRHRSGGQHGHPARTGAGTSRSRAERCRSSRSASASTAPTATRCPASPCAASAGRGVNALNGSDRNVFSGRGLDRQPDRARDHRVDRQRRPRQRPDRERDHRRAAVRGLARRASSATAIAGNVGNGIAIVEGSTENAILGNAVQGSEAGLIVDSSERNLLSLNKVSGAGDGVVVAGDANTVAGNLVERSVGGCEGCSGFGIGVWRREQHRQGSTSRSGRRPTASTSRRPGRRSRSTSPSATATSGSRRCRACVDGGGNRASGNGNSAQCVGVSCREPASPNASAINS